MAEQREEDEVVPDFKVSDSSSKKVDEILKLDQNDKSLNEWKAKLLGEAVNEDISPKDDPRRVVIKELRIHIEGRPDVVYTLETKEQVEKLKDTPFTLKEGCHYKTSIKFKVQHELVTGLKHVNTVYKKIIKVGKQETMIGSFPPRKEPHEVTIPRREWEEAPKGMMARGKYKANSKFVDDDGQTHLEYDYSFAIAKDWGEAVQDE